MSLRSATTQQWNNVDSINTNGNVRKIQKIKEAERYLNIAARTLLQEHLKENKDSFITLEEFRTIFETEHDQRQ